MNVQPSGTLIPPKVIIFVWQIFDGTAEVATSGDAAAAEAFGNLGAMDVARGPTPDLAPGSILA